MAHWCPLNKYFYSVYVGLVVSIDLQTAVVQKVDSAIHYIYINPDLVDKH